MKQTLKYILSQVNENLKYAENKHSILAAFSGAIVVFCATRLGDKYNISVVFSTIAIILCVISIFISFLAMLSRNVKLKTKPHTNNVQSLLYFHNIANFDVQSYLKQIITQYKLPKEYKIDGFDQDLAAQIIATSYVTKIKLKYYNLSLFFLVFGICFVVSSFAIVAVLP